MVGAEGDRFDRIVIDPGHGGKDEGAKGFASLVEKDLVLDVAKRLAARVRQMGIDVILTRSDDTFVGLEERTSLANESRADLFLSVHANSSRHRSARGTETFFASLEASDEAAVELAERENQAFGEEGAAALPGRDPVAAILGDLADNEFLRDSQEFARLVQERFGKLKGVRSRGVKQAPFVVLMNVDMPSALIELGFVTNRKEAFSLADAGYRDRLAEHLADAVGLFQKRYDARRGGPPAAARTDAEE